ncbi:MAG: hypothetical protein NTV44_06510 [Firmicutes bacterium]|nr:hypothetical protein [Bacillota bacterium]
MKAIVTFFTACLAEIVFSLVCFLSFATYSPAFLVSYFGFTIAFVFVIAVCIASVATDGLLDFKLNIPYVIAVATAVILLFADATFMGMLSAPGIETLAALFNLGAIAVLALASFGFAAFTKLVDNRLAVVTLALSGVALMLALVETMFFHFGFANLTYVLGFWFILANLAVTTVASALFKRGDQSYSTVGNISTLFFAFTSVLISFVMIGVNPSNVTIVWIFQLVVLALHLAIVIVIPQIPLHYYDVLNKDNNL